MHNRVRPVDASKHCFGWMGTILLLGILPIKFMRVVHHLASDFTIGIAPSILGPAGLLFLLLSSTGRIARLSLNQATLLVMTLSVTLELVQLLPRPEVLAHVHYTFDYYDLVATIVSVALAHVVAAGILRKPRPAKEKK